jgi:mRNA-degrading endonuclease RelE of RelBE toxin-antitoxin system
VNRSAYREFERLKDRLKDDPSFGAPLLDDWEGARAVHFGMDAYRLIWEVDEETCLVTILRVGRRFDRGGIYYQAKPDGNGGLDGVA